MVEVENEKLLKEIKRVEKKIDDHIEIYRENGEAVRENNRLIMELKKELDPTVDLIRGSRVAQKVFLFFTSLVIGAVGTYLSIKGLFK